MLVLDDKGLVHEVMDAAGTLCGSYHSAWPEAEAGSVVTCFGCMHPHITRECGHVDAVIMNCPYRADINNDNLQRCKCCDRCSHQCAMDI